MNDQMIKANELIDEELSDILWWQIPCMALMVGLGVFVLLGVLRFLVAGFITVFFTDYATGWSLGGFWDNSMADGFITGTHYLHGQLTYGAMFTISLLLVFAKLLGGKFRHG